MPRKKKDFLDHSPEDTKTYRAMLWIQKLLEIYNGLPSPVKFIIKETAKEIIKDYFGIFKQHKHPIKITDATKLIPDEELKTIVEIMTNDDFEEYPLEFKEYIFLEDRLRKKTSE
jgi:hypothetical protein